MAEQKRPEKNKRVKKLKTAPVRRKYRDGQSRTSIYFLLWTIFSVFSLLVVLLFGVSQQAMMVRAYKDEAAREVALKGKKIQTAVLQGPPVGFGDNFSGYVRTLAAVNEVRILILREDGALLFPQEPNIDPSDPEMEEFLQFDEEVAAMIAALSKTQERFAVYEGVDEYVYGAKISLYGDSECFLYVGESLSLVQTVANRMKVYLIFGALFLFVTSFAVSSAVAGWLTRPISEITKKAGLLARGDFNVDFHGNDYGSEMVELAETLNFARDELSKTDKMQKELIANVSHDFKTPLTMIKAYASMIMEISGDIPEKRNKHAQVIVDEADRLTSLVSDVLDISKIRSGIEELKREWLDMSACVHTVLERFAYLKDTQGYQFIADVENGIYVYADGVKLEQVLYNLIGNAVNYTGEDKKVYVSLARKEDGKIRFAVRDTGKGIKSEEINEIWDRYYRSREAHKRPVQGTGLGLSIVKTILQRHQLEFGVESELGKGSVFYVEFPKESRE